MQLLAQKLQLLLANTRQSLCQVSEFRALITQSRMGCLGRSSFSDAGLF
jgi:hypothetical protein